VDGVGTDEPMPEHAPLAHSSYEEPIAPPGRPLAAPVPIWKRITGPIVAVAVALAKWGALLFKLKVFTFAAGMLFSIGAYAWLWGWKFAVGFVLMMLIHELGHVFAFARMGIRTSLPMFIPFLGAFVTPKDEVRSVWQEGVSAIAGPVFGTLAAAACWWYAETTGSGLWMALAFTGFFLQLFNLVPMLPFDGGRVAGAIHPGLWIAGLIGLLGLEIWRPTPIIPIFLLLGGIEAYRRYKNRNTAESRIYQKLTSEQRTTMAVSYLVLIVVLVFAMHATYVHRTFS
jgi:Zn-dependent protease